MRKDNKGIRDQIMEVGMKEEGDFKEEGGFKEEGLATNNGDKEIMNMCRDRNTIEGGSLT